MPLTEENLIKMDASELEQRRIISEILKNEHGRRSETFLQKLASPLLNFIAILVGALIALGGSYMTRPKPISPPFQAEQALVAWELQTNPIFQSITDFMHEWPETLAEMLGCEIADLPLQSSEAVERAFRMHFRDDELVRQQNLQDISGASPQHVVAQMRIWFGGVSIPGKSGDSSELMIDYLSFGRGYREYKELREAIHRVVIQGLDPKSDSTVNSMFTDYVQRRILVSEYAHRAIAKWHQDPSRLWKHSAPDLLLDK